MSGVDLRSLVVGPAGRRVPWRALAAVGASGVVLAAIRPGRWSPEEATVVVRMTTVLIAAAAATCLDDPCEPLTLSTPLGRFRRRAVAMALTGVAVVATWAVVVGAFRISAKSGSPTTTAPVPALAFELVALVAVGWFAAAGLLAAGRTSRVSTHAAMGVALGSVMTVAHPRLVTWLWTVTGATWDAPHRRWAAIAGLAGASVLVLGRDPCHSFRRSGGPPR